MVARRVCLRPVPRVSRGRSFPGYEPTVDLRPLQSPVGPDSSSNRNHHRGALILDRSRGPIVRLWEPLGASVAQAAGRPRTDYLDPSTVSDIARGNLPQLRTLLEGCQRW